MNKKVNKTNIKKRIISGALVLAIILLLNIPGISVAISDSEYAEIEYAETEYAEIEYSEIDATILYFEQEDIIFEKMVETGTTLEELELPNELCAVIETAWENNTDDENDEDLTATGTSLAGTDQNSEFSLVTVNVPLTWEGYYDGETQGVYTLYAHAYGYAYNCEMPTAIITVMPSVTGTGSISGFVWSDGDGTLPTDWNGLYDDDELPLMGCTVYLFASDDLYCALAMTRTGIDGTYMFDNLVPGDYVLEVRGESVEGNEYLPPENITDDNKFAIDWSISDLSAFTEVIELGEEQIEMAEGINAGMRLSMEDASTLMRDIEYTSTDAMYCEKNAYINGSETAENGTQSAPACVRAGDVIRYAITTGNYKQPGNYDAGLDVLFLLDWSTSMGAEMVSGQSAIHYERDVMLDMSGFILGNYPNSRVAVMGMNSDLGLNNNPEYTNIQFQTDFLDEAQYKAELPNIHNAFNTAPAYRTEDLVSFFKAANFKMEGQTSAFGARLPTPTKYTIPRDSSTRTPVIFFISDFQIPRSHNNSNYWESYMKGQADRFDAKSNGGILHTVRFDHTGNVPPSSNGEYSGAKYDKVMQEYVSPAGRGHWGFTKVRKDTSYSEALGRIKSDFLSLASPGGDLGTVVTDMVPDGLEVVDGSINYGGVYDSDKRIITWDLSKEHSGEITVEFTAKVTQANNIFENTADVTYYDSAVGRSNTTYHKAAVFIPVPTGIDCDPQNIVILALTAVVLVISIMAAAALIKRSDGAPCKYLNGANCNKKQENIKRH